MLGLFDVNGMDSVLQLFQYRRTDGKFYDIDGTEIPYRYVACRTQEER